MTKRRISYPEILSITSPRYSERAADVIRGGGIVAFPTETYYGLGVDPFNKDGLDRLFELKKRSFSKPILVIIDNLSQLDQLTTDVPEQYHRLITNYWPGPLTLIFPALSSLSSVLTGGSGTIGIRMSSSAVATEICKSAGIPISATSANISGQPPATNVDEVASYFGKNIDLLIDGGVSESPQASTIATLDGQRLRIVRQGVLQLRMDEP